MIDLAERRHSTSDRRLALADPFVVEVWQSCDRKMSPVAHARSESDADFHSRGGARALKLRREV